ncbi:hypothetical protein [Dolichospermum sp. LEGE 00246]|uniref:hypothetical protein n=1 Tax=Dolichospermum sp. LEGE 00246 TaxID=1828605 RepID=UPI00188140E9|nr:hypothetical protein [Dolichospermum sp. LEGE 00246]
MFKLGQSNQWYHFHKEKGNIQELKGKNYQLPIHVITAEFTDSGVKLSGCEYRSWT